MRCPRGHPFDSPAPGCRLCAKAAADPLLRDWFARLAAGRGRKALPVVTRPPCPHEGAVVEFCKTCGGRAAEHRHVRQCGHPEADWDLCVRGVSGNPGVRSCASCGLHPAAVGGANDG